MDFAALAQHASIGWDVDGTLVGGTAGAALHRFITAHPQIRHCIVTFRTHGLLDSLEADLARSGFRDITLFEKVLSVPETMWLDWALQQQRRRDSVFVGKLVLAEIAYLEWKGFICRQHGLTALVDDNMAHTERGCHRYGVQLFDVTTL